MNKQSKTKIQIIVVLALFLASFLFTSNTYLAQEEEKEGEDKSLLELNIEIEKKRKKIEDLQKQTSAFRDNIKQKQAEAASLTNQLIVIDEQANTTTVEIEITETELEKLDLEIQNLQLRIETKQAEINIQKQRISELIKLIHKADQKTYLEITLGHDKFSDFFSQLKFLREIESQNQDLLDRFKQLKTDLESQKDDFSTTQNELTDKQVELAQVKIELDNQSIYKTDLLASTQGSEEKFKEIVAELKAEQTAINSELVSLERDAREKLELEDRDFDLGEGSGVLSWPVSPAGGISAYFHDPTYPYRYIFEHPAIDIRVSQGTPVAAAGDGYVVRAKNAGLGYSYIMLAHGNDLTTVYGHMSQINVVEDTFVDRGTIIGLSGGAPGTQGAGRLTTGAHLHFEVRIEGIPVNPLNYLP